MVGSASGFSEFAFVTASMRGAQAPCAPAGVCGEVSHSMAEISRWPWAMAKAWPIMPPMERPMYCTFSMPRKSRLAATSSASCAMV